MGVELIFGTAKAATSIAAYFGLIENVDGAIKKLIHAPFTSAIENLQQAQRAQSQKTIDACIEKARQDFTTAISLEIDENLISAFVGLAMCQCLQRDFVNARNSLLRAQQVQLTTREKVKAGAKTIGKETVKYALIPGYYLYKFFKLASQPASLDLGDYSNRINQFEEYKKKVTVLQIK